MGHTSNAELKGVRPRGPVLYRIAACWVDVMLILREKQSQQATQIKMQMQLKWNIFDQLNRNVVF